MVANVIEGQHVTMGKRRFLSLRVILAILAVASGLIILATFGIRLPNSFLSPVQFEAPIEADSNSKNTAIVDSDSRRVLLLNENNHLTGIIDCEALNSPIEAVTDVCVVNGAVYVAGVQYQKDSDIIARERVVTYSLRGNSEKVVYDRDVQNELWPTIKALDNAGDGVYVVSLKNQRVSADGIHGAFEIEYVSRDESNRVYSNNMVFDTIAYDVGYSNKAGTLQTINTFGVIEKVFGDNNSIDIVNSDSFVKDHVFTSIDVADNGVVYLYDDVNGTICSITDDGEFRSYELGRGFSSLHVNGFTLTACERDSNTVVASNLESGDAHIIGSASVSKSFGTLIVGVTVCRVYLVLYAVIMLAHKARQAIARRDFSGVGPMLASLAVVSVIAIAIGYISYGSYSATIKTRLNEVNALADYLSYIDSELSESMEKCDDRKALRGQGAETAERIDDYVRLEAYATGLANATTANDIGTYTVVYAKDDQGVFYLNDSSGERVACSSIDTALHKDEILKVFQTNEASGEQSIGSTLRDATIYRLVRIPSVDGKSTAGVIEIGSHLRSFEASAAQYQTQRILALLVIMLVVYLTYSELRACGECFLVFRDMKHHHDSIAVLTRPFSFFVTLLSSVDAVMTTLIARSLLSSMNMGDTNVVVMIPAIMLGVGLAAGQAIYSLFGSRVVIQKIMVRGAIGVVVAALFAAGAVALGNFWLYCLAKLLVAIPFGLLYTLSYSLPRRADTDDVRVLAAGGIKRTDTSAAALGTVLGGYAAQVLGNAWVYVIVAAVGVIVLIMAAHLLPKTKHPLEHELKKEEPRHEAMVKLITSRTTLPIILFIMLPAILAAGYNSLLFPLFSANLGIDTPSINNLFVVGQLVVYVCISTIEKLEERYNKWRVALVAVGLLGVVFLLFSFNTTFVWAAVTIALVGLLCKASDGWKAMWPRSAKANGLTTGIATGAMFAVRSMLLIVQPMLLGLLLFIGDRAAVIVLGVICAVCAVAFYYTTRHSAFAPKYTQR